MYKLMVNEALTFRSVLRTQMKVQTEGLLLDFNTTNPPGPFSPLKEKERELIYSLNMFCILIGRGRDRPDVAIMRGFADVVGRHSCRNVAVSPALHPTNIHKVPEGQKRERMFEFSITSINYHIYTLFPCKTGLCFNSTHTEKHKTVVSVLSPGRHDTSSSSCRYII